MSKEAYYFSHDANARNDPKILAMRSEYGVRGYGVYWIIIEMLREQDNYRLPLKKYIWSAIAMQTDANAMQNDATDYAKSFVESCINDFDLFESDGVFFWSNSLIKRMDKKNEISDKRRAAAKARWEKPSDTNVSEKTHDAKVMQNDASAMQVYANAMQNDAIKGKETKENKSIKNISSSDDVSIENEFDQFWSMYAKKTDKKKAFEKFKAKRKKHSFDDILSGTERYMHKCHVEGTQKQYIKGPAVFLNGDCFLEEHEIYHKPQKQIGQMSKLQSLQDLKTELRESDGKGESSGFITGNRNLL